MGWHPSSGIGVIALANARYTALLEPVREAIRSVLQSQARRVRPIRPWPTTIAAQTTVERLLDRWDDDIAQALFSMNVELDEPLPRRRAEFERLRGVHGRFRRDSSARPTSNSPAHIAWWLRGEHGRVRVDDPAEPGIVSAASEVDDHLRARGRREPSEDR